MRHIPDDKLQIINDKVYEKGLVDREHLLEFLTINDTNDAQTIINNVKQWLQSLHDSPKYDKVTFPRGDIDAIISDLDSYGRVQPEHILQYKQSSSRTVPMT